MISHEKTITYRGKRKKNKREKRRETERKKKDILCKAKPVTIILQFFSTFLVKPIHKQTVICKNPAQYLGVSSRIIWSKMWMSELSL